MTSNYNEASIEDLKKRIRTSGFSDGNEPDTPLRDVSGDLVLLEPNVYKRPNSSAEPRIFVNFRLDNIEVHESVAPYEYPSAAINLPTSDRNASGWGFMNSGINGVFVQPKQADSIWLLEGHRIRLTYQDRYFGFNEKKPEDPAENQLCYVWDGKRDGTNGVEVRKFFIVTEVDRLTGPQALEAGGIGSTKASAVRSSGVITSLDDPKILTAISGKTPQQAINAVMSIPGLNTNGAMVTQIMGTDGGSGLIATLTELGKIQVESDGTILVV